MDSKYINTVLSYIKSKSKKKAVEAELSDHISSNKEFFEEIGYDENSALKKPEEKMGDANITGEQFSVVTNNRSVFRVVFTVVSSLYCIITMYYIYKVTYCEAMMDLSPECWITNHDGTFIFFSEYTVILISVLSLFCYCIKKRLVISLAFTFLNLLCVILSPYNYVPFIVDIFRGGKLYLAFYNIRFDDVSINPIGYFDIYENSAENKLYTIIWLLFALIIISAFAVSLIETIRAKQLKINKRDLRIVKSICAVILVMVLSVSIISGYNVYKTLSFRKTAIKNTREVLEYYDKSVSDNIDLLKNGDKETFDGFVSKYFNEYELVPYKHADENDYEEGEYKYYHPKRKDFDGAYVEYYCSYENREMTIDLKCLATDLDGYPLRIYSDSEKKEIEKNKNNLDLVKNAPCQFYFTYKSGAKPRIYESWECYVSEE